ncbi:MAG: Na(+)/H(+) antiporter subunit D [Actinobacteria bacterium]|nr:Na(+)/H(+) antiporter subunit D [Actinomycetota bacterium]
MISMLPPAAIFIVGAFLVPFFKGRVKSAYLLILPGVAFINLLNIPEGTHWVVRFLEYSITFGKVDKLSMAFGYIFILITFIANLYALYVKDNGQHVAALLYAGSAIGAVFAGDMLALFVFWEIMAVTATYLIWASRTKASYGAGFRYLLVHIFGGLCFLAGVILLVSNTGSIEFGYIGLNGLASYLIFLGFGINAAFPVLHAWLPDAYPEATVTGAVFLSAFTTKTAVYVLARAYPGADILIWIGAAMAVFPMFYALIENDLRKVLSYGLISQLGFMVVGVGIGTGLSLNGTVAHAFSGILYMALLFMSMGAVLHQTGKINATDLGGLYKTMPLTAIFCVIGAASISAFPFFSGFVSKSMIVSASGYEGLAALWLVLIFASAGVLHYSGIRIPYSAFFGRDSGIRTKEAPFNMLLAMGIAAFLSVFIGVFPGALYSILPFPVDYVPYTAAHVIDQLQLLLFSALAFTLLMLSRVYPAEIRAVNLDTDWFYRKGAGVLMWLVGNPMAKVGAAINRAAFETVPTSLGWASKNPQAALKIAWDTVLLQFGSQERRAEIAERIKREKEIYPGDIVKHWPIGTTVLWVTLFLFAYLLVYYLS